MKQPWPLPDENSGNIRLVQRRHSSRCRMGRNRFSFAWISAQLQIISASQWDDGNVPIWRSSAHSICAWYRRLICRMDQAMKLQLQSQKAAKDRQFKGPIDCARQIIRVQGITGLWSGFTGSLAFRSNFFWMFLSFESKGDYAWFFTIRRNALSGSANFWSGGLGSFVYWAMAIPLDNIKNRMMAYPYPQPFPQSVSSAVGVLKRPSFFRVTRQIYSRDGLAGFFRGLAPCFLRAFPVNASAIFVYEGTLRVLGAEKVSFRIFIKA
ncbi:hypothetical protein CVT26_013999 [Gymnopilus dilepis]|uniref:Mitochondrial carrier n=1 Tax=Gymnopilus dilepis TaxID=231916 RepID=A0A409VW50_9AGAR|nr:hypothetical protein CVT26_013999 [Gymnopilus dilepis]